ncbi:hypothetical protein [Microbacterium sp. MM2322]|uniref:hypothetical protein n=1 Tax=Microbacterium sp. MM2322 TaxID=3157631 RepID=UPI003D80773F
MDASACVESETVSCHLEDVVRALSERDVYDWISLAVTAIAALATLAAVVVAVVTSVHATRVASESNKIAAQALYAEQTRHQEAQAREVENARRRAGYRITDWHRDSLRAVVNHWTAIRHDEDPNTFSDQEMARLSGNQLGRELEAEGHPLMVSLMHALRTAILDSARSIAASDGEPVVTVMHRALFQLNEALRAWWQEPERHESLLAAFWAMRDRSGEEFPDISYAETWERDILRALDAPTD